MLMVILAFATGTISAYQIGAFMTTRDMVKQQHVIAAAKEADADLTTRIVNIKSISDVKSISGKLFEMINTTKFDWVIRFLFVWCIAALKMNVTRHDEVVDFLQKEKRKVATDRLHAVALLAEHADTAQTVHSVM